MATRTDARSALLEGRIETVAKEPRRLALAGDHAAGATALTVDVTKAPFTETGGQVMVNGVVYTYSAYDDDAGTLTLVGTGLTTLADDGDWVNAYDPLYGTIITDLTALVRLPGAIDNDDALHTTFAQHLVDKIAEDIRGLPGEVCLLDRDNDVWRIVDILGLSDRDTGPAGGPLFMQDAFTVTDLGTQTFTLTYTPILNSEHLYWHPAGGAGIYQSGSEWTRDGQVITVTDPSSIVAVDDVFTVEYAYLVGVTSPGADSASEVLVDSPRAHYRLGDAPGAPAMTDSSGNGNHGAYAAVVLGIEGLLADDPDTCAQFDGATAYGEVEADPWMVVESLSVEAVIVLDTLGSASVIASRDNLVEGRSFQFRVGPTDKLELVFWYTGPDGTATVSSIPSLTTGTKYHVAATYDGLNAALYIDGVNTETLTWPDPPPRPLVGSPLTALTIGANRSGAGGTLADWFDGLIDEVTYYDYALTAERIAVHAATVGD